MSKKSPPALLVECFGPSVGGLIKWTFDALAVAERVDTHFGNPSGLFLLLRPTDVLRYTSKRVITAHMMELGLRFKRGKDTRPATAAEVLAGMLGAATIAPLNSTALALCEKLSKIVMDYQLEGIGRESYPGELKEIHQSAKRKLVQQWRTA